MSDMATMPIRELIGGLREKAGSAADDNNILNALVFNVLANRLEEQLTENTKAYNILGHALNDTENWQDWAKQWMDDNVPK